MTNNLAECVPGGATETAAVVFHARLVAPGVFAAPPASVVHAASEKNAKLRNTLSPGVPSTQADRPPT